MQGGKESQGGEEGQAGKKSQGSKGSSKKPAAGCDFRVSGKILSQIIDAEQIKKLLAQKKTDLLTGFVSQKTHRAFKAYLVLDDAGKVSFEFPPREASSKEKKK